MMLMEVPSNNNINKNEIKPVLLIEGPPAIDSLINRFMNLKINDSNQQEVNIEDHETSSTTTIFGSYFSNDSIKPSNSESEEENLSKSVLDVKKKSDNRMSDHSRRCLTHRIKAQLDKMFDVEDERKWLRYNIDSLTKEQAIIFCVLGQLLLCSDDIKGSRKEVPLPEDAKQILLFMTYGDHWLLRDLSYVMGYFDKVNNLIMSLDGLVDLPSSSRSHLETLIINQFGIQNAGTYYETNT